MFRTITATLKKRATFANVCSFMALTIALGAGSAYAANTVRSKDIVNGQVKTVDLGNNAVTTVKIKDGQVGSADLGVGSVGSSALANDSVTNAAIGADSIDASQLRTDSVGATEVADNTIDGGEIVDNSLTSTDLASGSVGTSEVADASLTGADIASNSIGLSDIVGTDASGAISLGSGSVAQGRCNFYNISVPGAVADQTVMISARASLPTGVILYGVEVPSADTVVMAACNFTGGTFPTLSSFPIRTVTFG